MLAVIWKELAEKKHGMIFNEPYKVRHCPRNLDTQYPELNEYAVTIADTVWRRFHAVEEAKKCADMMNLRHFKTAALSLNSGYPVLL